MTSNQAGSEESPFVLGDHTTDADEELERPETVSVTDTRDGSVEPVVPKGISGTLG